MTDTGNTTVQEAADENARLRAQLLEENDRLRAALAANAADGLTAQGLTDEDVRRIESPQEFVVSNEELHARLSELESANSRLDARQAAQPVVSNGVGTLDTPDVHAATQEAPEFVNNGDGSYTRSADNVRGSFGPDGFTPAQ